LSGANTHTHTLYGEETAGKLQQEELVWKSKREQYKDKMCLKYFFFYYDNTELREVREVAVGKNGINEDDDPMSPKPKAKGD
jgi:hypothetical protein